MLLYRRLIVVDSFMECTGSKSSTHFDAEKKIVLTYAFYKNYGFRNFILCFTVLC